MPEYIYGYVIKERRLLKRAATLYNTVPGKNGISRSDVALGSFINLARDAGVFGKVLLCHTEIKCEDEIVMALASNNPRDILPTYPSLPDPSIVERLKAVLETEAPPRWYLAS